MRDLKDSLRRVEATAAVGISFGLVQVKRCGWFGEEKGRNGCELCVPLLQIFLDQVPT